MSEERASFPPPTSEAVTAKSAAHPSDAGIDVSVEEAEPEQHAKAPTVSKPPPASAPASSRASDAPKRVRAKVTLKIPDDEVSRPQLTPSSPRISELPPDPGRPLATPSASSRSAPSVAAPASAPSAPAAAVMPTRIITIEPPPVSAKASPDAPAPPPASPSATAPNAALPPPSTPQLPDDSWTPYQPLVADQILAVDPPPTSSPAVARAPAQAVPVVPAATHPPVSAAPGPISNTQPAFLIPPAPVTSAPSVAPARAGRSSSASFPSSSPAIPTPPPTAVEKPPRPSQHAAAAKVVPAASPSAGHLPVAPLDAPTQQRIPDPAPTDPRNDVTTEDIVIPILAEEIALPIDEAPPSSGEVAVEPGDRPTRPAVLRVPEPKLVPAQPRTPAVAGPVAVPGSTTVHTAVTPMASAVVPSAVAPAVVQPVTDVPTPIVPPVSTLSAAATPAAVPPQPVTTPQAVSASAAPSPRRLSAVPTAPGSQPQVSIKDLPPMRALAPTEPEGLEVSFEDEEPAPETPSEPEAEIAAEDLVSVESAPHPSTPLAASVRAVPQTQTETPMRGFMPVGVPASGPASRVSVPPPPSVAKPPPSGGQKGAPRVIVPSGGALAPPPMGDAPTGRRKARPWWEELFNDDFIRTMAKISDAQIAKEVDFIEESLAVAKGAMLLDLGCGTGRHAIELTRRGYKVVGFDLSLPMLAKAAEEAQERSQKLNFVQGDMREMTFEDTFDGIYCWNTSFGFFEEDKNAQVVQRVHKALKKGGQFMLEVGNRDFMIRQAPSLAWFEGDGCICMDEMSIDWITSRMKVKRTMMMDDGRTKEIDYSVRIYSLHELGKVLHDAGFRVVEVSGRTGTPGVYFGNESPRTMILAEKK